MLKKKNKKFKYYPCKSKLEQVLWLIENYLPQKKDRGVKKILDVNNLEVMNGKRCAKLASNSSKTKSATTKNIIISFTFGNWAIPYLKFLKKIGIAN